MEELRGKIFLLKSSWRLDADGGGGGGDDWDETIEVTGLCKQGFYLSC